MSAPSLFVERQLELLKKEREKWFEQTALLRARHSPQELQRHGRALLALQLIGLRTGLGGRWLVLFFLFNITMYNLFTMYIYISLIELGPAIKGGNFPRHQMRSKDMVIVEQDDSTDEKSKLLFGVIWRLSDTRLIVALETEFLDVLGDRYRV
jgi:DNA polymerase alpha-associated DNA helicase A